MDCQTCNDLLLDLAYGELDEVRAAAVRKHADGCADCKQALRRIERGRALARQFPLEEPPALSDAVRAAIAAATAQPLAAAGVPVPPATEGGPEPRASNVVSMRPPRGIARWIDRVGELAMRRQVAMAAVFVVMLGVGLVFYQTHPRPSDTQDERVPDVVPAVEVASNPAQHGADSDRAAGSALARIHTSERDEQRARAVAASAPSANTLAPMPRAAHAHAAHAAGGGATPSDLPRLDEEAQNGATLPPPPPTVAQAPAQPRAPMPSPSTPGVLTPTHVAAGPSRDFADSTGTNSAVGGSQAAGSVAGGGAAQGSASASSTAPAWQVAEQNAQSAANRGDAAGAVNATHQAMAVAPSANTRQGIALRMAPILRRMHREQEADEIEAQAGLTTQTAMRSSTTPTSSMRHAAHRAAAPSADSYDAPAPTAAAARPSSVAPSSTASGL